MIPTANPARWAVIASPPSAAPAPIDASPASSCIASQTPRKTTAGTSIKSRYSSRNTAVSTCERG